MKPGTRVRHPLYGHGQVSRLVNNDHVIVHFFQSDGSAIVPRSSLTVEVNP